MTLWWPDSIDYSFETIDLMLFKCLLSGGIASIIDWYGSDYATVTDEPVLFFDIVFICVINGIYSVHCMTLTVLTGDDIIVTDWHSTDW